ncbi:OmpA/MotB domain protein [Desulfovibrio sp. X2]|uniref:OmpA/MotB family protein n=1 Tax=Desulfovibrio sp. X2 TaxID=941449 RepID=UPI000358F520|nr:OmpA family protein [Desulfovibrio sp. X2]EPR44030.1 OmpA/MotB domain protein [Desulfovibrio sp. X2]
MARRERAKSSGPGMGWVITFGDMITLLLTFFVLLLSMSSMDHSFLTRISVFNKDMGHLTSRGAGRIPTRVWHVVELMERPQDARIDKKRIQDLLFPDEVLPAGIDKKTLEQNLDILERSDGVVLVLSDRLLFDTGSAELSDAAKALLGQVAMVVEACGAPVNVAGFTDDVGGESDANYRLSEERALAVLTELLAARPLAPERFSVSAYGPQRPLFDNDTDEGRAGNRRVEILIKTQQPLGSYS